MSVQRFKPAAPPGVTTFPASDVLHRFRAALITRDAAGVLHGLQFIGASGTKRFLMGARVQGLHCLIGEQGDDAQGESSAAAPDVACLVEGFATGASVHEATGHTVAVGFHAGNLAAVARAIRDTHPQAGIVVCADDDRDTPGNPVLTHARQAALAVGGLVATPDFGPDRPAGASDFNDLHRHCALSAVRAAVRGAGVPSVGMVCAEDRGGRSAPDWADPEPLTERLDPLPYPADALPPLLRDAAREAQAFFSPALRDWESGRVMAIALDLAAREAALAAFEAKKAGILDAIKHKRRRSQDTAKEEGELDVLEARKVLLSAELNRRMEELLHGDNRWLAGPASAVPSTISVGGGITREDEETEIQALNDWVESQGLSRGVVSYDFADPQSGEQRAVFDLAWPSGLREELSQPVAVLLNEDAATIRIAGEAGFRCFTETKSFMRCVKEGVPREAVPA